MAGALTAGNLPRVHGKKSGVQETITRLLHAVPLFPRIIPQKLIVPRHAIHLGVADDEMHSSSARASSTADRPL